MKTQGRFFSVFLMVMVAQTVVFAGPRAPEKISYDSVPITQPCVALTFTDGPSSMLTPQVLKILADRNIKATFFVVGESALSHPDILKQEMAAGHEIGSRSWSHSLFGGQESDQQLLSDLERTDQAIRTATGSSPHYFCPFDTTFSDVQCDTVFKQFAYKVIYWSVDSLAAKAKGAAGIANAVISQAKPGSIILSSDIDSSCVQALPMVIDTLTSKGFKFVTVPELIYDSTPAGQRKLQADGVTSAPPVAPVTPVASTSNPPPPPASTDYPAAPSGYHPFGVSSPAPSVTVPDPNAPNATQ